MLRAFSPLAGLAILVAATAPLEARSAAPSPCALDAAAEAEEVVLETSDGLKLAATFQSPGRGGRAPGVLLVHDAGARRESLDDVAKYLRRRGFAVLTLDLRGHGKSPGSEQPFGQLTREDQERLWTFALRDLEAAGAFLRGRRDVHTTNLSVIGVGRSSALALRYASQDENVRAVALIGAGEDQLGFALPDEIRRCGGLPTLLVASKDERPYATRLVDAVKGTSDGALELALLRSDVGGALADKRLPNELVKFLNEVATPKRGG
jgi:pimeloyl-ACP methyl ester carboxylesterase